MNDYLILVDEKDKPWGKLEKLLVHQLGLLHRAFSVFIFNSKGELLLQQRADEKYHSGGLWTNTCCSHPRFGEEISWAIDRRLIEEMGMSCKTNFAFSFIYKTKFENGLTEHEFDHVYFGVTDDSPRPVKSEVKNYKYMSIESLEMDIMIHPENYTEWMKICLPQLKKHFKEYFVNNSLEYAPV
jgi:isopentenyl-diphosphate Delta-isomerase